MTPSIQQFIPCTTYREPPSDDSEDAPIPLSNRMQDATGPEYLAMRRKIFWPNCKVLRVLLIDRWVVRDPGRPDRIGTGVITPKIRAAVKKYVKLWEDHCSIRFDFVDQLPADIRVGFDPEDGHWSFVGTDSIVHAQDDERTMNLQFDDDTEVDAVRGTTLHEFGHALGCIHEHQSPDSPIQWNEPVVLKAMGGPRYNWSEAKTRHNILDSNAAHAANYKYTNFDPHSIMLYSFDASWTLNHKGTSENHDLSQADKYLIGEIYPRDYSHANRFHTSVPRKLTNPTTVMLSTRDRHSPPPKIAVGLTSLNIEAGSNIRVSASTQAPERTNVIIHLDSWFDTNLEAAGCTWIETPHGSFFQVGNFNTMETRLWTAPEPETETDVTFGSPFTTTPTVVAWINWIDADKKHDISIKAYATHVTLTGFTIHVDTWGDCILYSGGVSWIAYPTGSPGICSGVIETTRDEGDPHYEQTGTIAFPDGEFDSSPKSLIAVTSIDFAQGRDVNFDVMVDTVNSDKLDWRIKSSIKSMCRGIDATYLAY